MTDRVTEVTESRYTHAALPSDYLIHVLVQSLCFSTFYSLYGWIIRDEVVKEKLPLINNIYIFFFLPYLKSNPSIRSNRFRVTSTHSYAARRVWYTSSFLLDLIHFFWQRPLLTSTPPLPHPPRPPL